MNRVKPSVLLLLLLSLSWLIGCGPADSDDATIHGLLSKPEPPPPPTDWAKLVGDKIVITVDVMDSVLVIPSFYGKEAKDIEYVGGGSLPDVQTSCDPETFGPRVLHDGEWGILPHFYVESCESTVKTLHPTPYSGSLHYLGERTIIFRFESPGTGEPEDITYITIVMEGLDTGDTTDM